MTGFVFKSSSPLLSPKVGRSVRPSACSVVHIKAPDGTPMANAMLTSLHMLGRTDLPTFGDSSGELDLNTNAVVVTDAKG